MVFFSILAIRPRVAGVHIPSLNHSRKPHSTTFQTDSQIRRSNIVVAEPPVADEQIAKEFVGKLGDAELERVFKSLVEALNLVGDMGLLLRVEKLVGRNAGQGQIGDLFEPPEDRIRVALERFMTAETTNGGTRRRLFADDAAHGVALLSIAEKKFDVVLINPPFGEGSARARTEFHKAYPRTKNDVYAAFVERSIELLNSRGRSRSDHLAHRIFLSSFEKWRDEVLLKQTSPSVFADLGAGVLDSAMVETAAYCLEVSDVTRFMKLTDVSVNEKADVLREVVSKLDHRVFVVDPLSFQTIPGSPFAYWAPVICTLNIWQF